MPLLALAAPLRLPAAPLTPTLDRRRAHARREAERDGDRGVALRRRRARRHRPRSAASFDRSGDADGTEYTIRERAPTRSSLLSAVVTKAASAIPANAWVDENGDAILDENGDYIII